MSKLVYSALALTLVSSRGIASENEWSSLDQEIANLSASLSAQNTTGPKIGGWIISSYRNSDDIQVVSPPPGGGGTNDQGGFQLDSVRVELTGDAGSDYGYKLSFDFATTAAVLKDAYATWKLAENITGKMGNFKSPFLRSSLVSDNRLLFLDRSSLGSVASWNDRDLGIAVGGNFDTLNWWVAAQNGNDSDGDELKLTGRVEAALMGTGAGKVEGAYGAPQENCLAIGIALQNDGDVDDSNAMGADAVFTASGFSLHATMVDLDDGIGDRTPWDITGSYLFTDQWEAAVRYEDADDTDDTTKMWFGVNRYVQGHDIKWQAQYVSTDSDLAANEVDQIGVGLAVSF